MKSCQVLRFISPLLMVLGLARTAAWAEEKPVADGDLARWIDKRVKERQPLATDKRFDEIGWAHDIRTALALGKEHDRPVFLFTHDGRINTGRCWGGAFALRAGPLSDEKVIKLLNAYFVPVYVSNEEYRDDGAAPPEERKVYTQIYHEANQQKRHNGTVCVYLVAPDGKGFDSLIVSDAAQPGRLQKMLGAAVDRLKTKEGKPVIKPTPQAPPPKADKNELVLHLVSRYDHRGSWAEFPAENYIVLKQPDWEKLRPSDDAKPGATWDIDKEVAVQFLTYFFPQTEMCDFALATRADGPYKHKVERLALHAKLLARDGKSARIRLEGTVKLKHKFYPGKDDSSRDANSTVIGIVEFDASGKKPSLRLITDQAIYGDQKFSVALRSLPWQINVIGILRDVVV